MDALITWLSTEGRRYDDVAALLDDLIPRVVAQTVAEPHRVQLVTLLVHDYDAGIRFFCDVLGFELSQDEPSLTNDGRSKRWVVVTPPDGGTGLLLAQADGPVQQAGVGDQAAGRVGFFLRVPDFNATLARMQAVGVELLSTPRVEPYGQVVVFRDLAGNKWDLLGPARVRGSSTV